MSETRHTPVHKRKGTPWPLAPGPGPASQFQHFQISAVSRQQQAADRGSNREQAAAQSSRKNLS